MTFPADLLLDTVERLIDTTPHTNPDSTVHGVAHVMCDIAEEPRVRARVARALTGQDVRLTEMSSRSDKPGSTLLEAAFATHGPITTALSQLLALVWLEPAVSDLHWHLDQQPSSASDDADRPHAPVHHLQGLVVDLEHRTASVFGCPIKLTCMEIELLAHLLAHPRRAFTPDRLMELVWQQSAADAQHTVHTVDAHVARLRRKLGPCHGAAITSTGQAGYLLDPAKAEPRTHRSH
ncbi:winged helix-turn-helix domain-containing protein [Streptomyces abikoensis]|uniref:winged helix-turn-helix domain-containing protein n=1 Tax=Streptomyces abikoensis TaxID=97398 RepID=UPI003400EE94